MLNSHDTLKVYSFFPVGEELTSGGARVCSLTRREGVVLVSVASGSGQELESDSTELVLVDLKLVMFF